jgi:hypothetical protein
MLLKSFRIDLRQVFVNNKNHVAFGIEAFIIYTKHFCYVKERMIIACRELFECFWYVINLLYPLLMVLSFGDVL